MIKLVKADKSVFDKSYIDAQRVIGNVLFMYEGTRMMCDSAHIFKNDDFHAFGKIQIIKPGEFTLTGGYLEVNQKEKIASVYNDVRLNDNEMTLTSNFLQYNLNTDVASYSNGGKIVSTANQNVLTSNSGSYHTKSETFYFKKNVVLKNPDYVVKSDTLKYNDITEVSYFFGPTTITGEDSFIYCENGWYDSKKDISQFNKNAIVRSEKTELKGDSIYYNGAIGFGEVFKNVSIRDTTTNYFISGNYGQYQKEEKISYVTDRALLTQIFEEGDSLYMHADTLRSIPDSTDKNILLAYHNVRIFKSDLQGRCDSLSYSVADSILQFFTEPILWNGENQITGDSIRIFLRNKNIDQLLVKGNAFIISQSDSTKFNQIKGRKLTAQFYDGDIRNIYVEGNGQLVYYPLDEKKDSTGVLKEKPRVIGLNKGECSNINIEVENKQITKLRLEREANSLFSPMKKAKDPFLKMEGFEWKAALRPKSKEDLLED
ncbi:MAG: OstA-like protein [Flavobacteriales bacterium]